MTVITTSNGPAPPKPQPAPARPDVLPASARAKLIRLRGESRDAAIAAASASSRMGELKRGIDYADGAPNNLAAVSIEIARLDAVRKVADRKHRDLADLVAALDYFMQRLPRNVVLEEARVGKVSPNDGETLAQQIERLRGEIEHTRNVALTVEPAASMQTDL